ncbi:MAG: Lumazine-binding domain protein [Acidobacteria bacterium OLB17]|nr:MAG: Lumazine-binding domain protein [Acidobacteria bacterium OLB17]MCZ2390584.1 hypothetical protein [Acidobacteriota bacterium]
MTERPFIKSLLATLILALPLLFAACGSSKPPATPLETFETYAKALKKKDYTSVKILLSASTMKMHEQEAKAQNTTVDEIIKRGSLVADNQTNVKYRNEKVDGDKATIEIQNTFGSWETVHFVREDGVWKLDIAASAQDIIKDIDDQDKIFDQLSNSNIQP